MNIEKSTWACRKRLLSFFIMATAVLTASSQTYPPKDSPQLEFALQLRVHISEPYISTVSGRMMVSISMSVTGDWYVTVRTLTELPIIISKPPPSLRHPRTAAMRG